MRFRVYFQDKNGTYVDLSPMVEGSLPSFGFKASADDGTASLVPAGPLTLRDVTGIFSTLTRTTSSRWAGDWSERLVKFTVVREYEEEADLAVFRIKPERGVVASSHDTVKVHLEPLEKKLQRGDASDVNYRRGWHQQIPWTSAIDLLRKPEYSAVLDFPSSLIENEGFQYGVSTLGRPGDYQDDGFHEIVDPTVGVTYNTVTDKFAFATTQAVYEWDPDTGEYSEINVPFTLDSDHDFLGIWFRRDGGGSNHHYLLLSAPREVTPSTSGVGYYQPRNQMTRYVQEYKIWSTAYGSYISWQTAQDANFAPVVYRDVFRYNFNPLIFCGIGEPEGTGSAGAPKGENVILPVSQYPFTIFSRLTQSGEDAEDLDRIQIKPANLPEDWHPLIDGSPYDNTWEINRDDTAPDREEFDRNRLRLGTGYYGMGLILNGFFSPGTELLGLRHTLGNGPLFDMVIPDYDSSYDEFSFVFFFWVWDTNRWRLKYQYNTGIGTGGIGLVDGASFDGNSLTLPTFVQAVMEHSNTGGDCQIYVVYGWISYGAEADSTQINGEYSKIAKSGVGVAYSDTQLTAAISWEANATDKLLVFSQAADASAVCNKVYASGDVEGRWTPVGACVTVSEDPWGYERLYLNLFCLDRMDCYGGEQGVGIPYRLFYLQVDNVNGSSWAQVGGGGDGAGDGTRKGFTASLPPMGMTKEFFDWGGGGSFFHSFDVYFFNPSDGGVYRIRSNTAYEPEAIGYLSVDDTFLTLGRLAAGNINNVYVHQVVGGTSPAFPLTGERRWPDGLYYGFFAGEYHSGRVGLLDLLNTDKHRAIGQLAQLGDSVFYFDRSGAPQLEVRPTDSATSQLTLTKQHYGSLERYPLGVTNFATRGVHDVVPGEPSVKVHLTPDSYWNVEPALSGFGVYAIDLELKCLTGGMVSESTTRWAFRQTNNRVTTRLRSSATQGLDYIFVDVTADIEPNDLVTLSTDDDALRISSIDYTSGRLNFTTTLDKSYAESDPVFVDKKYTGLWSDQLSTTDATYYRGVSWCGLYQSAGYKWMRVGATWPFAVGTRFKPHHINGGDDYGDTVYVVTRVEKPHEWGDPNHGRIYFERDDGSGLGLATVVHTYAPITAWIITEPSKRAAQVGQTGLLFTAYGVENPGSWQDAIHAGEEEPVLPGDKITVHYPGLKVKKNSVSKATCRDIDSVSDYGEKKAARLRPNKFMDHPLATMDVNRRVRRGAAPREGFLVRDVTLLAAQTLEPLDVITLDGDRLMADFSSHQAKCMVVEVLHNGPKVDLRLEELGSGFARDRGDDDEWDPTTDTDLVGFWWHENVHTGQHPNDGAVLEQWRDQSPNGNDGTPHNSTHEPTYDGTNEAVLGDGASDGTGDHFNLGQLQCHSNTDGLEVWVLYKASGTTSRYSISQYDSSSGKRVFRFRDNMMQIFEDATTYDGNGYIGWTPASDSEWHIIRYRWVPGEKGEAWLDGVSQGQTPLAINDLEESAPQDTILMGTRYGYSSNACWDHPLKGIAVFNKALDASKAELVEAWLESHIPAS